MSRRGDCIQVIHLQGCIAFGTCRQITGLIELVQQVPQKEPC
jgi:hypothetical protein